MIHLQKPLETSFDIFFLLFIRCPCKRKVRNEVTKGNPIYRHKTHGTFSTASFISIATSLDTINPLSIFTIGSQVRFLLWGYLWNLFISPVSSLSYICISNLSFSKFICLLFLSYVSVNLSIP